MNKICALNSTHVADAVTPAPAKRVLGVDTSLRSSGVAVVQAHGSRLESVEFGLIKNPPARSVSQCLHNLALNIAELIERYHPDAAAVEGIFFCKNIKTVLSLGQARGVVLAACAAADVPVYEYPPRRVKQSVTGYGNAGKEQVRRMIMAVLNLSETPSEDAADALAIAVCHLYGVSRYVSTGVVLQEI